MGLRIRAAWLLSLAGLLRAWRARGLVEYRKTQDHVQMQLVARRFGDAAISMLALQSARGTAEPARRNHRGYGRAPQEPPTCEYSPYSRLCGRGVGVEGANPCVVDGFPLTPNPSPRRGEGRTTNAEARSTSCLLSHQNLPPPMSAKFDDATSIKSTKGFPTHNSASQKSPGTGPRCQSASLQRAESAPTEKDRKYCSRTSTENSHHVQSPWPCRTLRVRPDHS